ncbi:MAG: RNA-binding S4 domain-containing protein [Proteobacteria bacterium]|nr:RNA-binding S4 domain-containing protein [Pseudomonadota bacterium]MBU1638956.1 RNA-binding S4 domain-containing protein [Pseudomonadota bacterium]
MTAEENNKVRIDKWLWAARFFKTRSTASQAVSGGKVHVNDARVKAARMVAVGDRLRINRNNIEFIVDVVALAEKRGPAKVAQTLYQETAESLASREQIREEQKVERLVTAGMVPPKRPGKRDRRLIKKFIRKSDL